MRAYLAGPMRGLPNYNKQAFYEAQLVLESLGYTVFNPHVKDEAEHRHPDDIRNALADDMWWICHQAEILIVLPGWEKSLGATAEMATARALPIPVITYEEATEALYVA